MQCCGGNISATAHWLREDNVWSVLAQMIHHLDELQKPATEIACGDLTVLDIPQGCELRVDQGLTVIIQNNGPAQTPRLEFPGRG